MAHRMWLGPLTGAALLAAAGTAEAGLEICNDTAAFQSVAIGYMADEGWTSEGWWLIEPGGCAEPLGGDLQHRFYYYRALVDGETFEGSGFTFCTEPDAFTIVGDTDCEARGFATADFREIDTGETALHHVERIVATSVPVPPAVDDVVPEVEEPDEDDLLSREDDMDDDVFMGGDNPRRGASRL